MLRRILNLETKSISGAAAVLFMSALLSRFLGFWRDRLLAEKFGAGEELDAYFAAFRIPDFIYGILIVGGITTVFLPIFSEYFKKEEKAGWNFANNILNCFFVLTVFICAILFVFAPQVVDLIAPGFDASNRVLTINLTKIMLLSPIFFGLASVFSGILQYFNKFLVYSIAPILYNLGIIFGIVALVPVLGVYGLVLGVILGALFYWLLQIPSALGSGYKYSFILNFKEKGLIQSLKMMAPRILGIGAYNVNLIVITAIASVLGAGAVSIFNFSNNMQYLPIGLIGISFSLASFPLLSKHWVDGLKSEFLKIVYSTVRQILFLIVPASVLMFILREQITRIILGTGRFDQSAISLTSASLGLFCFGIFAAALIPFLVRVFYSFQDTKTPVIISVVSMAGNIALSFFFISLLKTGNVFQSFLKKFLGIENINDISVIGLALAVSISALIQMLLLFSALRSKVPEINFSEMGKSFLKILISSVFMAACTILAIYFLGENSRPLLEFFVAGIVGGLAFLSCGYLLKLPELKEIKISIFKF